MLLVLLLYLKALTLDVLVRRSRFPKQDSKFEEEEEGLNLVQELHPENRHP